MFTGYGKGWSEPKAPTKLGRLLQRMREPATSFDCGVISVIFAFGMIACAMFLGNP